MVAAVSAALNAPAHIKIAPAGADEVAATLADTTRCESVLGVTFSTDLRALVRRQVRASGAATHTLEEVG